MRNIFRKELWWLYAALGFIAVVTSVVLIFVVASSDSREITTKHSSVTESAPAPTVLETVGSGCSVSAAVRDSGRSITLDTGRNSYSSGHSINDVACVLGSLRVPDSVVSRIENTRALDGMQTATWDGYTANWNYHPDSGLFLVIEDSAR